MRGACGPRRRRSVCWWIAGLVAVGASIPAIPQVPSGELEPPSPAPVARAGAIDASAAPVEIELRPNRWGGMIVRARLNSRYPVLLLIDTGASASSFDRAVAARLGLVERDDHKVTIGVGGSSGIGGSIVAQELTIARVSFGAISFHAVDLESLRALDRRGGSELIDGILGADFLAAHQAVVDYPRSRLTLVPWQADTRPTYLRGQVALAARGAPSSFSPTAENRAVDQPLVGAQVSVATDDGQILRTRTDRHGRFAFGPLPARVRRTPQWLEVEHRDGLPGRLESPGQLLSSAESQLLALLERRRDQPAAAD